MKNSKETRQQNEVTRREIICIFGYLTMKALNLPVTITEVFQASTDTKVSNNSLNTTANRWIKSDKITHLITETNKKINTYLGNSNNPGGVADESKKGLAGVDFSDKDAFLDYVTRRANSITDEKQRLDYLKILADIQRFKESKTDEAGEIQRFYTPFQCSSCPLYQNKHSK